MELNPKQLRLLKKISKKDVVRTDKYQTEDIEHLRSNGLVTVIICDKPDDFYYQPRITEKGKAVLYERTQLKARSTTALILSIVAVVISFLTAFTPFSDWSRALIEHFILSLF
jgi:hypothetical protein